MSMNISTPTPSAAQQALNPTVALFFSLGENKPLSRQVPVPAIATIIQDVQNAAARQNLRISDIGTIYDALVLKMRAGSSITAVQEKFFLDVVEHGYDYTLPREHSHSLASVIGLWKSENQSGNPHSPSPLHAKCQASANLYFYGEVGFYHTSDGKVFPLTVSETAYAKDVLKSIDAVRIEAFEKMHKRDENALNAEKRKQTAASMRKILYKPVFANDANISVRREAIAHRLEAVCSATLMDKAVGILENAYYFLDKQLGLSGVDRIQHGNSLRSIWEGIHNAEYASIDDLVRDAITLYRRSNGIAKIEPHRTIESQIITVFETGRKAVFLGQESPGAVVAVGTNGKNIFLTKDEAAVLTEAQNEAAELREKFTQAARAYVQRYRHAPGVTRFGTEKVIGMLIERGNFQHLAKQREKLQTAGGRLFSNMQLIRPGTSDDIELPPRKSSTREEYKLSDEEKAAHRAGGYDYVDRSITSRAMAEIIAGHSMPAGSPPKHRGRLWQDMATRHKRFRDR